MEDNVEIPISRIRVTCPGQPPILTDNINSAIKTIQAENEK